jgi:hypothetical protein
MPFEFDGYYHLKEAKAERKKKIPDSIITRPESGMEAIVTQWYKIKSPFPWYVQGGDCLGRVKATVRVWYFPTSVFPF